MLRPILISLCLWLSFQLSQAQSPSKVSLSLSYLGQLAIHPGMAIGSQWTLLTQGERGSFFVGPQIGFYARPADNVNLLLASDLGYLQNNKKGTGYKAYSVKLGYQHQWQLLSTSVNLNDGTQTGLRDQQNYLLVMANFEHGKKIGERLGLFSKYSVGGRWPEVRSGTLAIFWELGLRFQL